MKLKVITGLVLALFLIGMLTFAFNIQPVKAEPTTIIVPDDYAKIQWAIGNASDGNTIFVRSGTYHENVVVGKSLALVGEEKAKTIIEGSGTGNVVLVTADNVNISGFTVQNGKYPWNGILLSHSSSSSLIGNNVVNNYIGIELEYSSNNTIINNTAAYNTLGIRLLHSSNNMLVDNTPSENGHGINLAASGDNTLSHNTMIGNSHNFGVWGHSSSDFDNNVYLNNTADGKPIYYVKGVSNVVYDQSTNAASLYVINSVNVTVKDLKISDNDEGIQFWNTSNSQIVNVTTSSNQFGIVLKRSNFNVLFDNFASNNAIGIYFERSDINRLASNNVDNNIGWGIHFYESKNNTLVSNKVSDSKNGIELDYCSDNVIYHNNFFNNLKHVSSVDSKNIWDDGYPSGGNYWSDYADVDLYSGPYQNETGRDGIGDAPYGIDENNQDNYPLMNPWPPTPVMTATIDIDPDTLNLKSKGKWIACYIELPEGYNVSDIDVSTILLNDTVPAEWSDIQDNVLMVKFNRTAVISLLDVGNQTIKMTGELADGTPFEGTDMIRAIHAQDNDPLVPEFPTWTSILLILIMLTVAIVFYKRRLLKTTIR